MLNADVKVSLLSFQHWTSYEFLTWRWWLKLIIFAVLILIGIVIVYINKKRRLEMVSYGLLVSLIATVLDVIGTDSGVWQYPVRLFPVQFSEIHDLLLIPVSYMLIYQSCKKWKSFLIASAVVSIAAAYVIEPIFALLNFYKQITWRHIYSLPVFFVIAVFGKFIIGRLKNDTVGKRE